MAKIFGKDREIDFAPSNLMSFGKSFSRMGGQPLDESEVWYNLTDLEAFAASDAAYVGMKVVYVDETNNKVYQYSIQLDGSLKEIGVAPIGDDSSITVTAEGLVSLFGFASAQDGMLPVREDGKITWKTLEAIGAGDGNDNTTYEFALNTAKDGIIITPKFNGQPIMSGEGDEATQVTYEIVFDVYTTGEADEKFLAKADYTPYDDTELSSRVETIEKDYLKAADKYDDTELAEKVSSLETVVGSADSGLVKDVADNKTAIATEKSRAEAAEAKALSDAKTYTNEEIAGLSVNIEQKEGVEYIVVKNKAGEEVSAVNASKFVQDSFLDDVSYDATTGKVSFTWKMGDDSTKTDEIDISALVDTYTAGNGIKIENNEISVDDTIVATVEELNKVKETAEAAQTAQEVSDAIDEKLTAANLGQYAKTTDVEATLADYAKTADVVSKESFEEFKTANDTAIIGARSGAVSDVEAKGYAVATDVANTYATKEALKTTSDKADSNESSITNLTSRLDGIVAQGGEPNTINNIKVNGVTQTIADDKSVDIAVPTKVADLSDGAALQEKAQKGVDDASTANAAAKAAQDTANTAKTTATDAKTLAETNKNDLANLSTRVDSVNTSLSGKIGALETKDSEIDGELSTIKGSISTLQGSVSYNVAAITALQNRDNELANLVQGNTDKFDNYYTKEETNSSITAALEDYSTTEETTAAIQKALEDFDQSALETAIATINDKDAGKSMRTVATEVLAGALEGASEDFDTLMEMAQWLDTHSADAVTMDNRIKANETILAGIGGDGQPATVLAAIEAAAYELPAATAEALGGVKSSADTNKVSVETDGTMLVNSISTDKLVQGASTLVLNGGSSEATTA